MGKIIIQVNGGTIINVYVIVKSSCMWKKYENGKHLASIMDDSYAEAKSYDKTDFNGKKATCKTQNFYILLGFLLITITLLTAVGIYCYLIKYWAKQNHLLPFNFTNDKLKEIIY